MTDLHLRSTLLLPGGHLTAAAISATNNSLNGSTLRTGWVFQVPNDLGQTLTITKLLFRYGARTGTPPTYRASLQGVGTDGFPDGTVKGGGSPASVTFTPPADTTWNGTVQEVTLDNSYAATPGELLAMVIDYSSGTVDGSNFSSITRSCSDMTNATRNSMPYACAYGGASWSTATGQYPVYGFRTASHTYGFPLLNLSSTTLGTNGNRACLKYTCPAGSGGPYKLAGFQFTGTAPTAGSNTWKFGIWDSAGTALATGATLDADYSISGASRVQRVFFTDSTLPTLLPGVTYYIGVERTNASCVVNQITVQTAADLEAFGGAPGVCLSTWNGSAWSDTDTARPDIELIWSESTFSARSRFQLGM